MVQLQCNDQYNHAFTPLTMLSTSPVHLQLGVGQIITTRLGISKLVTSITQCKRTQPKCKCCGCSLATNFLCAVLHTWQTCACTNCTRLVVWQCHHVDNRLRAVLSHSYRMYVTGTSSALSIVKLFPIPHPDILVVL